ncbi:MAG TPA: fimbrial assembly protein [Terracidiphilus sp.]|jgi:type IV pilus assembly protein PilN
MKISINLATRPFADIGPMVKRLRIAMASLAVVSIGLGLGLYFLHNKADAARARDHSLDGQISQIRHEREGYEALMKQPDNAQILTEAANLNRLFDEKAFSWTLGMEDLETVLPGGVQVTTLEPIRDKQGLITLRLRVIGPRDKAVSLVQNLEHSRHFLMPRIVTESSENSGMPGEKLEPISASNKVNFDVLADYNPSVQEIKKEPEKQTTEAAVPKTPKKAAVAPHAASLNAPGPGLRRPMAPGYQPPAGMSRPPMTGVAHPPTAGTARPSTGTSQPPQAVVKPRAGGPQ